MRIIEIEQHKNGSHICQTTERLSQLPIGWAIIPEKMETPNLPYGDITVETICGVPTVTSWTPREMPVVEPTPEVEAEPTAEELIDILLGVDEDE